MSKEAMMTFQVEPELQADFHRAAEADHRPVAQVLRDLMSGYVEQVRSRAASISPQERKRREDAVNYARASVGLEGFRISEAEERHARRFINGQIDMTEFLKGGSDGAAQER